MISDDERREVAERLMYEVGCGSSWPGMERLGVILGVEGGPGFPGRFLSRLADLIEPSDHIGDSDKMVDRDALLALADKMSRYASLRKSHGMDVDTMAVMAWVHRIREALGVSDDA